MGLFWRLKKYWSWRWLINKMTMCQSRFVMSCIVDFILYNTCVSKYDYLKYAQMHISKYAHGRNRIPGWRALSTLGDMTKKQPMRFVLVYIDVEYNFLAWLIWDPFLAQGPLSLSDSGPLRPQSVCYSSDLPGARRRIHKKRLRPLFVQLFI